MCCACCEPEAYVALCVGLAVFTCEDTGALFAPTLSGSGIGSLESVTGVMYCRKGTLWSPPLCVMGGIFCWLHHLLS